MQVTRPKPPCTCVKGQPLSFNFSLSPSFWSLPSPPHPLLPSSFSLPDEMPQTGNSGLAQHDLLSKSQQRWPFERALGTRSAGLLSASGPCPRLCPLPGAPDPLVSHTAQLHLRLSCTAPLLVTDSLLFDTPIRPQSAATVCCPGLPAFSGPAASARGGVGWGSFSSKPRDLSREHPRCSQMAPLVTCASLLLILCCHVKLGPLPLFYPPSQSRIPTCGHGNGCSSTNVVFCRWKRGSGNGCETWLAEPRSRTVKVMSLTRHSDWCPALSSLPPETAAINSNPERAAAMLGAPPDVTAGSASHKLGKREQLTSGTHGAP